MWPTSDDSLRSTDLIADVIKYLRRWLKVLLGHGTGQSPTSAGNGKAGGDGCTAYSLSYARWEEYVPVAARFHRMEPDESLSGRAIPCSSAETLAYKMNWHSL